MTKVPREQGGAEAVDVSPAGARMRRNGALDMGSPAAAGQAQGGERL